MRLEPCALLYGSQMFGIFHVRIRNLGELGTASYPIGDEADGPSRIPDLPVIILI